MELLEVGHKVLLVDSHTIGQKASWAGGGILSPLKPWQYGGWHNNFTQNALIKHQWLYEKLSQAGLTYEILNEGMLYLNEPNTSDFKNWYIENYAQSHPHAQNATRLSHLQASTLLQDRGVVNPQLKFQENNSHIWLPNVSSVRNPQLLQALRDYVLRHHNSKVMENTRPQLVFGLDKTCGNSKKIIGVELTSSTSRRQFIPIQRAIITAGAWSSSFLNGLNMPRVKPIKGQMLLYRLPQAQRPRIIIMWQDKYIIPRADGHLLVGSSVEDVGFDDQTTMQAQAVLHQFAQSLLPQCNYETLVRSWAGLRPATVNTNGLPIVGSVPKVIGLWVNTGHYRNGIVHAPAAASRLAQMIEQPQKNTLTQDNYESMPC